MLHLVDKFYSILFFFRNKKVVSKADSLFCWLINLFIYNGTCGSLHGIIAERGRQRGWRTYQQNSYQEKDAHSGCFTHRQWGRRMVHILNLKQLAWKNDLVFQIRKEDILNIFLSFYKGLFPKNIVTKLHTEVFAHTR